MEYPPLNILLFVNFFFLGIAVFFALLSARRWNLEAKRSKVLLEIAERYQRLCDSTADGVFQCNENGEITVINHAGAVILGFKNPDDIIHRFFKMVDFFLFSKDRIALEKRLLKETKISDYVVQIKNNRRERLFLQFSINILNGDQGILFEGIFRNITQRVELKNELQKHRDSLEELVKKRTGELEELSSKLKILSRQLITLQEKERKEISRELHDEVGQALLAVKIDLEGAQRKIASKSSGIDKNVNDAYALTLDLIDRIHELSLDLRPSIIDELGLIPALRWYTDRYSERTHIDVDFHASGTLSGLSSEVEISLYRIVQEALTNIVKHAKADRISIALRKVGPSIHLRIKDNGRGFNPGILRRYNENKVGLFGIREKVGLLQGTFQISSEKGKGTVLKVVLPGVPE